MNKIETFNSDYELPSLNKKWFTQISNEDYKEKIEKGTISGKPSKVWKDIIKRFFKNKWNIIFLSIFLGIIFLLIFGGFFSKFSSSEPIVGKSTQNIRFLLPGFAKSPKTTTNILSELQANISGDIKYDPTLKELVVMDSSGALVPNIILSQSFNATKGVWTITYNNPDYISTIMGTNETGVAVWPKLIESSRFSIGIAFLVTIIESIIGTVIGLYLGYNAGKAIDTYFMRIVEVFTAVPALLLVTIFVLLFGKGFIGLLFSLLIIGWVAPVYVARLFTIKVKDAEFIKASQSIGASQTRIIFKHVLPNVLGRITVSFVRRIPSVIFIEATLIFLGIQLGGESGNTLGTLLQSARSIEAITNNPYYLISASAMILLFTLSLQILANGLRDAFDAKVSS